MVAGRPRPEPKNSPENYFAGWAGCCGAGAGAFCIGACTGPCCGIVWTGIRWAGMPDFCSIGNVFLITEEPFTESIDRKRDVSINTTAEIVVSLLKSVAAPRLPKSVWLDPPKAAPNSAPLLL